MLSRNNREEESRLIIIIFIYLPSDVISQEKKLQLPLGLSPKNRNMQFL